MKKYKFYSLRDKSEEALHIIDAPNTEQAYLIASQIKQLQVEDFKKIFKVKQK